LNPGGRSLTFAVTVTTDPSAAKSTVPICPPSGVCSAASAIKEAGPAPTELVTVDDASREETVVDAVSVESPVINAAEDTGAVLPLPLPHPTNNRLAIPATATASRPS
jgi:hypothetical protein